MNWPSSAFSGSFSRAWYITGKQRFMACLSMLMLALRERSSLWSIRRSGLRKKGPSNSQRHPAVSSESPPRPMPYSMGTRLLSHGLGLKSSWRLMQNRMLFAFPPGGLYHCLASIPANGF